MEADILVDQQSSTVARWVHTELFHRYGTPHIVCTDSGSEFWGAFESYLVDMGVRQSMILP